MENSGPVIAGFEDKRGTMIQGMRAASTSWKRQENNSSLESQEITQLCHHLNLAQWIHSTCEIQTIRQ